MPDSPLNIGEALKPHHVPQDPAECLCGFATSRRRSVAAAGHGSRLRRLGR